MRQDSTHRKSDLSDGNGPESHGDWKTILSFFVFLIFPQKYQHLCFFNVIRVRTHPSRTKVVNILMKNMISSRTKNQMCRRIMKIPRELIIINVFINKIRLKIFGPLAGSLNFGAYGTGDVARSIHVKFIFFKF